MEVKSFVSDIAKYKYFISAFLFSLVLSGCTEKAFKGDLVSFKSVESEKTVKPEIYEMKDSHIPLFAVSDTIVLFYNSMAEGFSFSAFNLESGKLLGKFFPCGHGHGEYVTVSPVFQIFEEKGQKKTLIQAPNEDYVMIWNITKSLETGSTVCEKTTKYGYDENMPVSVFHCEIVDDDKVLTYRGGIHNPKTGEVTAPIWQTWSYDGSKHLMDISLFRPIKNDDPNVMPESFFAGAASVKPDRTKFVEAMLYLPQITIVDVKSGKGKGFLMKDLDDYSIFSTDMSGASYYYRDVQSSDDFIFALWSGKQIKEYKMEEGMDEVHVFDWDGNMIKKIRLSEPVQKIFLDTKRNVLYGCNAEGDRLYRYEI